MPVSFGWCVLVKGGGGGEKGGVERKGNIFIIDYTTEETGM